VLRGLAALYVMLGHARWLLWASQHEYAASAPSKVGSVLAVLSASLTFGHQAVLLFFLISGFCIHYRQARSLATSGDGRMNLKSYAWRRLRRLYPPLLLALALTALFDSLGASLNPAYYAGQTAYPSINDAAVAGSRTLTTLFGGLLFQSSLATPSFGTNGPLWSLSYELWFSATGSRLGAGRVELLGGLGLRSVDRRGVCRPRSRPVPALVGAARRSRRGVPGWQLCTQAPRPEREHR
jgi:peptidoglycan/LPS O-acetylase OafA/YrhL